MCVGFIVRVLRDDQTSIDIDIDIDMMGSSRASVLINNRNKQHKSQFTSSLYNTSICTFLLSENGLHMGWKVIKDLGFS